MYKLGGIRFGECAVAETKSSKLRPKSFRATNWWGGDVAHCLTSCLKSIKFSCGEWVLHFHFRGLSHIFDTLSLSALSMVGKFCPLQMLISRAKYFIARLMRLQNHMRISVPLAIYCKFFMNMCSTMKISP